MKTLAEFAEQLAKNNYIKEHGGIDREYKISSATDFNKEYSVIKFKDKTWECTCIAGLMGRECKHIKFYKNNGRRIKVE